MKMDLIILTDQTVVGLIVCGQMTNVRRAHIDVVDARATKGLWMMHVCYISNIR